MNIILYSKPGCPQCKVLKTKLDMAHLEYQHVEDVDAILALGLKAAPVLQIDGSIHCGPEAIKFFNQWIKERNNSGN